MGAGSERITKPTQARYSFAPVLARPCDAKAIVSGRVTAPRWQNFYNNLSWKRGRLEHLRRWPFCKFCAEQGRKVPATVVDHIKPHRGDVTLFWDRTNWQSLCKTCHDGAKQRLEKSGKLVGSDAKGIPLDPNHHWHH